MHSVYGSPDVLEIKETAEPVVKDDEVRVRVHAAAVNPPDWAGVYGEPYIVRRPSGCAGRSWASAARTWQESSMPSART